MFKADRFKECDTGNRWRITLKVGVCLRLKGYWAHIWRKENVHNSPAGVALDYNIG